ncbi:ABC transporter permease [Solihabitans fulvus]|uniref:ABC transporter permease n=1 Tax=Solihabitans fulvus TaxID=1892852 RepID=A0A5B2WP43_9PSEU|nr:ABC transporter permease [Solihabitans fulvus]KAA2252472.1 ABC transporter permease [Solihabitans fulvus]
MLRFLVRRVLGAVLILFVISAVTFFLFFALPSDPARLSCGKGCTPELLATIHHNLGIDRPLPEQYWSFLTGIFAGRDFDGQWCSAPCLGFSFVNHQPVLDTLLNRFPATLSVALGAAALMLTVGVGLGLIAALRRGKTVDKVSMAACLVGASVQIYFFGIIARYLLVDELQWLPQPGYTSPFAAPGAWFGGMVLPWITLTVVNAATYARYTRSSMVDTLGEDYVRTARAKGLSSWGVYIRHAWRGAMTPVVTTFGIDLGLFLGGALITETTFNIHGIGKLAVDSVANSDLPMIMGTVLVAATAMVLASIAVDACYAVIDPRVRLR